MPLLSKKPVRGGFSKFDRGGATRPIVFGLGTPWRTWGTRPVPIGFCCDIGSAEAQL
jgi:hypothetical protein